MSSTALTCRVIGEFADFFLMSQTHLPAWAEEFRRVFRAGTISQFLLFGNIFDFVPYRHSGPEAQEGQPSPPLQFKGLKDFLSEVLFSPFEVVLYYSRGAGIQVMRGQEHVQKFQQARSEWGLVPSTGSRLPKEAMVAMEFLESFLRYCRGASGQGGQRVALIIDFVQYLVPQAEAAQMSDRSVETIIRLQDWASDRSHLEAHHAIVLISESLGNLSRSLVESVYCHKIRVPLPQAQETDDYLQALKTEFPELPQKSELPLDILAKRLVGLTRVSVRHVVAMALRNGETITARFASQLKKELIEKECYGLLDFVDSRKTMADVAGLPEVRRWLRRDAEMIRKGQIDAIPMGYLLTGRIGTGKTWLANCFAGEIGIPFVVLKNFRDKWMGATEGNLEKIFAVLKALGQVMVFIDEADQMTGKRSGGEGDSGLSGRIYGMLAKEMSETQNRGKIIWVFATSRPDMLEVDLKRPGRLDVHIPLFPPQSQEEYHALFISLGKKVGLTLSPDDVPALPIEIELGGNEVEALLVRSQRLLNSHEENTPQPTLKEALAQALGEYRPLPHRARLEFMDLQAVKECTDSSFLPERWRKMEPATVDGRLQQLQIELRI